MNRTTRGGMLGLFLGLAAAGVSGAAETRAPRGLEVRWVYGRAGLGVVSPLVGATVSVLDESGHPLRPTSARTGPAGTFAFSLDEPIPAHFRLAVSGGLLDGSPFPDTLLLDVDGFDAERDILHVNAVTTLVSLYRDHHAGASLAGAETAVKGLLGLPRRYHTGYSPENPHLPHFSHTELLARVVPAGLERTGLSSGQLTGFLRGLIVEHGANPAYRRPFVSGENRYYGLPSWEELAEELGKAAGEEAFGFVFDKILTEFGINESAEILNALHEIEAKLDRLTELVEQLLVEAKRTQLEVATVAILENKTHIDTLNDRFTAIARRAAFAALTPPGGMRPHNEKLREDTNNLITDILADRGARFDLHALQSAMMGYPGTDGILVSGHAYIKSTLKTTTFFYTDKPHPMLLTLLDYYTGTQFLATNLLVQAHNARHEREKVASVLADFRNGPEGQNGISQQSLLLGDRLRGEFDTIVDMRTNLMWRAYPVVYGSTNVWPGHYYWTDVAAYYLRQFNSVDEFKNWRFPQDFELDGLLSSKEFKDGESRYDWLTLQGFRGFDRTAAYFSSSKSGVSGYFYYAIRDSGVQFVCNYFGWCDTCNYYSDHYTARAGGWYVRETTEAPPAPGGGAQ